MGFSGIRIWIVGIEGEHAYHLTATTTAQIVFTHNDCDVNVTKVLQTPKWRLNGGPSSETLTPWCSPRHSNWFNIEISVPVTLSQKRHLHYVHLWVFSSYVSTESIFQVPILVRYILSRALIHEKQECVNFRTSWEVCFSLFETEDLLLTGYPSPCIDYRWDRANWTRQKEMRTVTRWDERKAERERARCVIVRKFFIERVTTLARCSFKAMDRLQQIASNYDK